MLDVVTRPSNSRVPAVAPLQYGSRLRYGLQNFAKALSLALPGLAVGAGVDGAGVGGATLDWSGRAGVLQTGIGLEPAKDARRPSFLGWVGGGHNGCAVRDGGGGLGSLRCRGAGTLRAQGAFAAYS